MGQPFEPQRSTDEDFCRPQRSGIVCSTQERFLGREIFTRLPLCFTQGQQERAALRLVYDFLPFQRLQGQAVKPSRLGISWQLDRSLTRLLPVGNRALAQSSLRVVMGYQLWLGLNGLGEPLCQYLSYLLVILLAFALQQRLVRGVLY